MKLLGATAIKAVVDAWARARLSKDDGGLGYPSASPLWRIQEYGPAGAGQRGRPGSVELAGFGGDRHDTELVDEALAFMAWRRDIGEGPDLVSPFLAWYLGIVAGVRYRGLSQRKRAALLRMPWSTYRERVQSAYDYISDYLQLFRDRLT